MKPILSYILVLATSVLILGGCGHGGDKSNNPAPAPAPPVEVNPYEAYAGTYTATFDSALSVSLGGRASSSKGVMWSISATDGFYYGCDGSSYGHLMYLNLNNRSIPNPVSGDASFGLWIGGRYNTYYTYSCYLPSTMLNDIKTKGYFILRRDCLDKYSGDFGTAYYKCTVYKSAG